MVEHIHTLKLQTFQDSFFFLTPVWFSVVAVANYYKINTLKQHNYSLLVLDVRQKLVSLGPNQGIMGGGATPPLEAPRTILLLSFLDSKVLCIAFLGSWPLPPSLKDAFVSILSSLSCAKALPVFLLESQL